MLPANMKSVRRKKKPVARRLTKRQIRAELYKPENIEKARLWERGTPV